jgi:hypothetical protein
MEVLRGGTTSFCLSFRQGLLGRTGAHWLDGPADLAARTALSSTLLTVRCCLVNSRSGFESTTLKPAEVEVHLVELVVAVVLAVMLPLVLGLGAGRLAPAGRVTPVLAGRPKACLAVDLSSSCRHRPGPPSSLA